MQTDATSHNIVKAHANGRNIVGQQHATLLGPTCCVRLQGTTTMLALVAYSLKTVKLRGHANGRNIVGQKPSTTRNLL